MDFEIILTEKSEKQLLELKNNPGLKKQFKAVSKTLRFLSHNPKHPSLNTHEYTSLTKELGQKIFEAYAENHTPGAYRVFWYYGDEKGQITIIYITPHP